MGRVDTRDPQLQSGLAKAVPLSDRVATLGSTSRDSGLSMASGIPGMSGDIVLAPCVVVAFHDPLSIPGLVAALTGPGLEVVVVNVEADEDVQPSIQGT